MSAKEKLVRVLMILATILLVVICSGIVFGISYLLTDFENSDLKSYFVCSVWLGLSLAAALITFLTTLENHDAGTGLAVSFLVGFSSLLFGPIYLVIWVGYIFVADKPFSFLPKFAQP